MIDDKLINRINELAKLKKQRELTKEEAKEQKALREQYLEAFRKNVRNNLENIDIVDHVIVDKRNITLDEVEKELKDVGGISNIEEDSNDIKITYLCKQINKEEIINLLKLDIIN